MSSYILRGIDPGLWRRLKSEAALEGCTIKTVIERLIAAWLDARAASAYR